jgi:hypothetical protein
MLRRDPLAMAVWLIVFAWLAASAGAFWFFELSDWRAFSEPRSRMSPSVNTALVEQLFRDALERHTPAAPLSRLTFVHLYNPKCRCNRFTEPHLRRLKEAFEGEGVRFMAAAPAEVAGGPTPLGLEVLRFDASRLHAAGVDSAPSALIFDGGGRLIYYGPYSNSAWCGSAGALVDAALKRALSGSAQFTGVPASRGCFCEW